MNVWVLTKTTASGHESDLDIVKILGVYKEWDAVLERLSRIREANSQYPMAELGPYSWRLGPEDDEGFFGNQPVYLRAEPAEYHG